MKKKSPSLLLKPQRAAIRRAYRLFRASLDLTQRDIAEQIDILSHDRYVRIENGYANPTPDERKALASLFGITVDDLPETEDFLSDSEHVHGTERETGK